MRPAPLRAILLCRVSTKHAEQETSLERQLANLRAIASGRGWRVVDEIAEQTSGASILERPAVAAALDKIIANKADVLVVDHLFRLGRNVRELLQVIDTLAAVDGSFYEAARGIDAAGPLGRMVFTIYSSIGEFEIADRKLKVREGLDRARARGVHLGPPRRFPLTAVARALELRQNSTPPPSWNMIRVQLAAEGHGKHSRGAISAGVLTAIKEARLVSADPITNGSSNPAEEQEGRFPNERRL